MAEKYILAVVEKEGKSKEVLIPYREGREARAKLAEEGWAITRATTIETTTGKEFVGRRLEQFREGEFTGKKELVKRIVAEKIRKEVIPRQVKKPIRPITTVSKTTVRTTTSKKAEVRTSTFREAEKLRIEKLKEPLFREFIVEKETPKDFFLKQPTVTRKPEKQRVVTEILFPQRQTLGGKTPSLRIEQPRSVYESKKQVEIATGTILTGMGLGIAGAGIAGISPTAAKGVSLVGKTLFAGSLIGSGLAIAKAPKEEKKYVAGRIAAGFAGALLGAEVAKGLTMTRPKTMKVKELREKEFISEKGVGKIRREVVLEETKSEIMKEGVLKFKFEEKTATVKGKTVALEYKKGKGAAGRVSPLDIPPPRPEYPYESTLITKRGLGIGTIKEGFKLKTGFYRETVYRFPKPVPIEKTPFYTAYPATKELGALKEFKITAPVTKPSITPLFPVIKGPKLKKEADIRIKEPTIAIKEMWQPQRLVPKELIEIGYPTVGIKVPKQKEPTLTLLTGVRPKTEEKLAISSIIGTIPKTKERVGLEKGLKTEFGLGKISIQTPSFRTIEKPKMGLKQSQMLKPAFETPTKQPPTFLKVPTITTPVIPSGITIFGLPKARKRKRRKEVSEFLKPTTRYEPSFTGIYFGITAPKAPKGILSGIGIRPIIVKKGKKKRRRIF